MFSHFLSDSDEDACAPPAKRVKRTAPPTIVVTFVGDTRFTLRSRGADAPVVKM